MKKYLMISLLTLMLMGCSLFDGNKRYYEDQPILITGVQLTTDKDYTYVYTIKIMTSDNTHSQKSTEAYMYSNKRYGMGDHIWIGARWGRRVTKGGLDTNN